MNEINNIEKFYESLFMQHGDAPQSCSWTNKYSQIFRFNKLIEIADLRHKKILDVGCGVGDLYGYLNESNIMTEYTGVDVVDGMIEVAAKKYANARFWKQNIVEQSIIEKFDYVLMSGIFNYNLEKDEKINFVIMQNMLLAAYDQCINGIAFNFISSYVNYRNDEMAYFSPSDVLDFCIQKLSPKVSLFHHYEKCDVTIFVYK